MTKHAPNHGIATMIDPPDATRSRTILVPKVRPDHDFVFLLFAPTDDAGDGSVSELCPPAGRGLRPNDGVRRWR